VVCHSLCKLTEMHRFSSDKRKRVIWVNAVCPTPEEQRSLTEVLSVTREPYLCSSHFTENDYSYFPFRAVLRPDAVPFYEAIDTASKVNEDPAEINVEAIDESEVVRREELIADAYNPSVDSLLNDLSTTMGNNAVDKSFSCPNCDEKFSSKYFLKWHSFIHSGEQKLTCPHCDREFLYLGNLSKHIRTHKMHSFSCLTCGEKFAQKVKLNVHLASNLGHRGQEQDQSRGPQKATVVKSSIRTVGRTAP
ncbi:hypothetical protein PMAYCL1PPCAC_01507, partial [Pristionchus mayeri]